MQCYWLLALLAPLGAASEMPSGIFHGKLTALDGTAAAGEFSAQDADGASFSCGYDARSYFELNKARVPATNMQPGDPLEVLADRKPGTRNCYARIVHITLTVSGTRHRVVQPPARPARASEFLPQRGDRNLAGIVVRREAARLTLRTRDGERFLVLRPDTRFLGDGLKLDAAAVPLNAHVFVRAGSDGFGQMEAYTVMWGEIVNAP
jgi:hypothetical protein